MVEYVIIGVIASIGITILICAFREDSFASFTAIFGAIFVLPAMIYLIGYIDPIDPKPTAIDVYRNKTTLQITYQDSIPVDTVVVWKDEFKK